MIRQPNKDEDLSFIYATWANQVSESQNPVKYRNPKYLFVKSIRRAIERAIYAPGTAKVLISCDAIDPNVIYGYLVYQDRLEHEQDVILDGLPVRDRKVIHFLYIKQAFRGNGLAKELLKEAAINTQACFFTCYTNDTEKLHAKSKTAIYLPLGLFDI